MTYLKRLIASVAALGALAMAGTTAEAASISTITKWNGVNIQGEIVPGDEVRFVETMVQLDPTKTITVVLNSPGGSFGAAANIIHMMVLANEKYGVDFNTYVGKTDECASACTYLWAMGTKKFVAFGGQLYVHAVVNGRADLGAEDPTTESLTLRAARFYKMSGAPDSVVAKALEYKPEGNVIGYPEIGQWGGLFLSDVDGHQFARCEPVGPSEPLSVTCYD